MRVKAPRPRWGVLVFLVLLAVMLLVPAGAAYAAYTIQGTVVSAATGLPMPDARVTASQPNGSGGWNQITFGYTDSNGHYSIAVSPGVYRMGSGALVHLGAYYKPQYYNGKSEIDDAADVDATVSGATGIDFALSSEGPSAIVKLTDTAGNPLPMDANVVRWSVYSLSDGASALTTGTTMWRNDGVIKLYGLNGSFKIKFWDQSGYYDTQWFSGKADWASATAFTASVSAPADLGTVALKHTAPVGAGTLRGMVTDAGSGKPLPFAIVSLNQGATQVACARTKSDGTYSFTVAPATNYELSTGANGYDYKLQGLLTVVTGMETIADAALDLRPSGGRISGVVRGSSGGASAPLSGATVLALDAFTGEVLHCAVTGADGAYSFPLWAGEYLNSYVIAASAPLYESATSGANLLDVAGETATVDLTLAKSVANQVYGASRYSTSVMIAQQARPGFKETPDLILASGEDRAAADPLSAAGLSWAYYGAPILLTQTKSVPGEVLAAIKTAVDANPAGVTVHVVGGPASVPNARLDQIRSYLGASAGKVTFDRLLSTGTRFEMAAAIAARMKALRGWAMPGVALVANGVDQDKFFDALSLSAVSASKGAPILLVGADTVPAATAAQLKSLGMAGADIYVGGGTKTVSAKVLTSLGVPSANRIAGPDRYATAVAVADKGIAMGWLSDHSVGAAAKLPDALTGGAVVGGKGGPLLVTNGIKLSAAPAAWLAAHKAGVKEMLVFGGPKSVSAGVKTSINNALK